MSPSWSLPAAGLVCLAALIFGCADARTGDLPVVYDFVSEFDSAELDFEHVAPDTNGNRLNVPVGAGVSYFLDVPSRSILSFRGPEAHGQAGGSIRVMFQQEGGPERTLARLEPAIGQRSLPLPVSGGGRLARISFIAEADREGFEGKGALSLVAPSVRVPLTSGGPKASGADPTTADPATRRRLGNVVVYLIDTLRADHLGCYGYERPVSPKIDAFAQDAVVFERGLAQSSWTKPSVASIFTGKGPLAHGVETVRSALPESAVTLAEILSERGIVTAGFVTNGHVTEGAGFGQGFQRLQHLRRGGTPIEPWPSDRVNGVLAQWVEAYDGATPFFLYVHIMDPHGPYDPPERFRRRLGPWLSSPDLEPRKVMEQLAAGEAPAAGVANDLEAFYDGEIAFSDDSFGVFLEELKSRDLYDDTLIVLLGDHGEAFGEHGTVGHWKNLHREILEVPLIVKFPARMRLQGKRVSCLSQHVDVFPTVLDVLGLPTSPTVEGRSLLSLAASGCPVGRPAFAAMTREGRRALAVVKGDWKMIEIAEPGAPTRFELYHRRADPGEQSNVGDAHPVRAGYLRALLRSKKRDAKRRLPASRAELDEATWEGLRALGYVEDED